MSVSWRQTQTLAACKRREIDETTSATVKLAREQVQQIQYIGRVVDIPVVRGKWRLLLSLLSRDACVFLKPVTLKLSWFH